LSAPISVEMATAGSTKLTEFQKLPLRPPQLTPVQALDQALIQASNEICSGSAMRLPPRMSSSVFSDVVSITNSGIR